MGTISGVAATKVMELSDRIDVLEAAPPAENLIAPKDSPYNVVQLIRPRRYWPLQELSGASGDDVLGADDFVAVNGVFGAIGPSEEDTSLDLSAAGAYAYIPANTIAEITAYGHLCCFWVYITATGGNYMYSESNSGASAGVGFLADFTSGNGWGFNTFNREIRFSGNPVPVLNTWYRVAAYVPPTTALAGTEWPAIFVNGQLKAIGTMSMNAPGTVGAGGGDRILSGVYSGGVKAHGSNARYAHVAHYLATHHTLPMIAMADYINHGG